MTLRISTPTTHRNRGAARLLAWVAAAMLVAACSPDDPPGRPPPLRGPGDVLAYETVGDLVAASDAVVVARVIGTSVGRRVNSDVYRLVELQVDEVLAGTVSTDTILVEEEAFIIEPDRVIAVPPAHRSRPAEVGETWIAALDLKEGLAAYDRPVYGVLGRAGFFLVAEDQIETQSNVVDGHGTPLAALAPSELKEAFRNASEEAPAP